MKTTSKKKISTDVKIFLAIILFCFACIGAFNVQTALAYNSLRNVASTLPTYNGIRLANGETGTQDCYAIEGSSSCDSLQITITNAIDITTSDKLFIEATKQQGITWYEDKNSTSWLSTEVFERNSKQYQIYISHEPNGHTTVSLVQY